MKEKWGHPWTYPQKGSGFKPKIRKKKKFFFWSDLLFFLPSEHKARRGKACLLVFRPTFAFANHCPFCPYGLIGLHTLRQGSLGCGIKVWRLPQRVQVN